MPRLIDPPLHPEVTPRRALQRDALNDSGALRPNVSHTSASRPAGTHEAHASAEAITVPRKHDNDKPMLQLIPPELLFGAARGLTFGAAKYAPGNWATGTGFDHSRLYGALQRHLWAYWGGESRDPESGLSHLDHAACMLAFLMAHVARGKGVDDRVAVGAAHATSARDLPQAAE